MTPGRNLMRYAVPADHGGGTCWRCRTSQRMRTPACRGSRPRRSRSLADPAAGVRPADHGLCRSCLCDVAQEAGRDLAHRVCRLLTATGALLAASADIYLITSATLLVVQRLWVSGQFAASSGSLAPQPDARGHHRARGRVAARKLRQQGVPPRPHACGRNAGAGWRRADAGLHGAHGRDAGIDAPPGARLDLAASRQRQTRGPQFGQRRGRREPQLRRRVRVGDRRRSRRSGSGDRPRPGIVRSRPGVELRLLGRRRQHPDPAHGRCRIFRRAVHAGSFGRRSCHDRDGAGHRGKPGVRHGSAAELPLRPRHQEAVRQGHPRRSILARCWRWATSPSVCSAVRRIWNGPIATAASIWCKAATSPARWPATPTWPRCRTIWPGPSNSPRERKADQVVFAKNELSEMLPRPTPLSLSLMESLWAAGGSVDLAARELGLTLPRRGWLDLSRDDPRPALRQQARGASRGRSSSARSPSRRLLRTADRIERDFREHFLPQFIDETRLLNVVDFEKLSTEDLVAEIKRLHDRFVFDTHVAVDVVNIAAGFYPRPRPQGPLGGLPSTRRACSAISRRRTRPAPSPRSMRRRRRAGAGCC